MIIPELPDYLKALGGEAYIGYIISLFTITALISRPFSGKFADRIGRVPVMVIGAVVSAACGILYLFTGGVLAFLALRLFHGFSTGFTPTGSSAYVADLIPQGKRGEAMGMLSLAGSVGMAAGPALGSWLVLTFGYQALFLSASALGFVAVLWMIGMRETLAVRERFSLSLLRVRFHEFYEPRVLLPALVLMLAVLSFGTLLTLIPDKCKMLGLENKGVFFSVFTAASVLVRFSSGRVSDRIGREKVLLASTFLLATAMIVLAFASSIPMLLTGAVLFGLGNGINSPTIMAWAVDRSVDGHVGRAMATVYMALEIGIGAGAWLSGTLYAASSLAYPWIFMTCSLFCLVAFSLLVRSIAAKRD